MSLKALHIVFIIASIGLSVGLGGWCLNNYLEGGSVGDLIWAIVSFVVGLLLVGYSKYFIKKLKDISYL